MRIKEVIEKFLEKDTNFYQSGPVHSGDGILWSYSAIIAAWPKKGLHEIPSGCRDVLVTSHKYSVTTTKHTNLVKRMAIEDYYIRLHDEDLDDLDKFHKALNKLEDETIK